MNRSILIGLVAGFFGAVLALAVQGYLNTATQAGFPGASEVDSDRTTRQPAKESHRWEAHREEASGLDPGVSEGAHPTTDLAPAETASSPESNRPLSQPAQPATAGGTANPSPPARADLSPEELINISVYEKANRGVVNIRTEISLQRGFIVQRGIGAGSGWVVDKFGHIVTNYHVIENSKSIEVMFFDGKSVPATLIGEDPANDIALLKVDVDESTLFPLSLGNSDDLQVGQKAIAIGNPFGFERSMTSGIVSSINRAIESSEGRLIKSVIQVDTALNTGNSGGPLLDSQGELIGMNTAIKTAGSEQSAQNSGVGFAVPVNTIKRVVPQLKQHGRVIRASIGIAQALPTRRGLVILELIPNGPADQAGLIPVLQRVRYRLGNRIVGEGIEARWDEADIILSVNGTKVTTFDDLLTEVEKKKPGQAVRLQLLRDNRVVEVELVTTEE